MLTTPCETHLHRVRIEVGILFVEAGDSSDLSVYCSARILVGIGITYMLLVGDGLLLGIDFGRKPLLVTVVGHGAGYGPGNDKDGRAGGAHAGAEGLGAVCVAMTGCYIAPLSMPVPWQANYLVAHQRCSEMRDWNDRSFSISQSHTTQDEAPRGPEVSRYAYDPRCGRTSDVYEAHNSRIQERGCKRDSEHSQQ